MSFVKKLWKNLQRLSPQTLVQRLEALEREAGAIRSLLAEEYVTRNMVENPRYSAESGRLNRFEWQTYSQRGEDGILAEIFRRIGGGHRYFVEFGAGGGQQNNTMLLLTAGWKGAWIEGDPSFARAIRRRFRPWIESGQLALERAIVSTENVEELFTKLGVPTEFGLLSIDVDGNDYWLWRAIERWRPKVVVIEYNAVFPPPVRWVMKHQPEFGWRGTSYFGASLESLEHLGNEKGYCLVGCTFSGVNAFFVRDDLVEGRFEPPYTAAHHYEPVRYELAMPSGHPRGFGEFERL